MAILNLSEYQDHPTLRDNPGLQRVLKLFDGISSHPRPSKGEDAVRKHLLDIAAEQGWEVAQDEIGNVAVFVPATPGKEEVTPVILQGHMDMVTDEKKDAHLPRRAVIEDKGEEGKETGLWMRTEGEDMTLGSDNGIGLSLAMGAMMDPELEHGPVTILMTIDEETGMSGAKKLDPRLLPELGILVNLDSEEGPIDICIGCAGSSDIVATFPITEKEEIPQDYEVLELTLKDFPGGHSGVNIHHANGNAIQSLAALLKLIQAEMDLRLASIDGGMKRNSIPNNATAVIAIPEGKRGDVQRIISDFVDELGRTEPKDPSITSLLSLEKAENVQATLSPLAATPDGVLTKDFHDRLLDAIDALPTGPFTAAELPNVGTLVTLSNNLGVISTQTEHVQIQSMARSANIEALREKLSELEGVFRSHGAEVKTDEPSAGWLENPTTSPAVALAQNAARQVFGEPRLLAYHAGLESGIIADKRPGTISAVAIGPLILAAHTEKERVSLGSVAQEVQVLRALLQMVQ